MNILLKKIRSRMHRDDKSTYNEQEKSDPATNRDFFGGIKKLTSHLGSKNKITYLVKPQKSFILNIHLPTLSSPSIPSVIPNTTSVIPSTSTSLSVNSVEGSSTSPIIPTTPSVIPNSFRDLPHNSSSVADPSEPKAHQNDNTVRSPQNDKIVPGIKYIYTVTEAARFLGVSADTLRNWEANGKLIPKRTKGGARRYYLQQLKQHLKNKSPYLARALTQNHPVIPDTAYTKHSSGEPESMQEISGSPIGSGMTDNGMTGTDENHFSIPKLNQYRAIVKYINLPNLQIRSFSDVLTALGVVIVSIAVMGVALIPGNLLGLKSNAALIAQLMPQDNLEQLDQVNLAKFKPAVLGLSTATYSGSLNINLNSIFNSETVFNGPVIINDDLILNKSITSPNVLYSLAAGDGISVSAGQTPTITNTGVLSLAGKTGALTLTAGTDITIDGLTITDKSTLDTVRGRGGCSACITDADVVAGLTISGGSVNDSPIGASTASTGAFTTLTASGAITLNGNITLGDAASDTITFTGGAASSIIPATDSIYDLGSAAKQWGTVYATNLNVSGVNSVGQLISTYVPTSNTVSTGPLYINPTTATAGYTLAGFAVGGAPKLLVTSNGSLISGVDGSADLGSASVRWNNLYVNTLTASGTNYSGQATFSYEPTSSAIGQGPIWINPTTATAAYPLLSVSVGGVEKARITSDGYLGLNGANDPGSTYFINAGSTFNVSTAGLVTATGVTSTAANTFSVNGAASTPSTLLSGTWFTGGSATTTKPQLLIEPSGTTSTAWSTTGTGLGINAASGFTGMLIDAQLAGVSKFTANYAGAVTVPSTGNFNITGGTQWTASTFGFQGWFTLARNQTTGGMEFTANGLTSSSNGYLFTTGAVSGGTNAFVITHGADTAVTAEKSTLVLSAHTQTITGGFATFRDSVFNQPTITAASALNISTQATTMTIAGAPISAGSATIANAYALKIDSGTSVAAGVTNSYGLYVDAPTGASNNYAATFATGNVGIGDTSPSSQLEVGDGTDSLQISSVGDMTFVDADGAATITGPAGGALNINPGSVQSLVSTSSMVTGTTTSGAWVFTGNSLTSGTGMYVSSSSITQGKLAQFSTGSANTLTTGTLLDVRSTATSLTGAAGTGSFVNLDWSPGSATTATGDLFALNIGTNGTTTGNLFNILDSGSSIFSISENAVTSSLPTNFTSSGDVAIAYDINFTNPTASYIKSIAPINITAGETFNSANLTFQTYNFGSVVVDSTVTTSATAATKYAFQINTGDTTTTADTIYGLYSTNALSGAAAKTGIGLYSTVTTSSTTSDTIIAADLTTSATGIIGATTRTNIGLRTQPVSTSANTAGTQNMYGIYSAPSATLAAGSTENVYGGYFGGTATLASGTINRYGLYVDNATMNTTGTSTQYGLYIASQTGADTNYGLYNAHNGVVSGPAEVLAGTWFTGGSATTTKPQLLIEPSGTTSTAWSTSGTGLGINAASGFTGNLLDLQVGGSRKFNIASDGQTAFVEAVTGPAFTASSFVNTNSLTHYGALTIQALTNGGTTILSNAFATGLTTLTITHGADTAVVAEKSTLVVSAHTQTITGGFSTFRDNLFGQPTISAASGLTVTTASTLNIAAAPTVAGSAVITNTYGLQVGGATTIAGAAASTYGAIDIPAHTVTTNTTTQITSTPAVAGMRIGQITVAQSGGAVTVDSAASLYIADAPVASTDVTLTNPYAIWVDAGKTRLDGQIYNTAAGAASTPAILADGTWFTGGSATTTKPQMLIEPAGTTSTGWSTSGTGLGVNAASGFAGNLIDAQVAANGKFRLTSAGVLRVGSDTAGASTFIGLEFSGRSIQGNYNSDGRGCISLPDNGLVVGGCSGSGGGSGMIRGQYVPITIGLTDGGPWTVEKGSLVVGIAGSYLQYSTSFTNQRTALFHQQTLTASTGTPTITNAITTDIIGAPIPAGGMILTNTTALRVASTGTTIVGATASTYSAIDIPAHTVTDTTTTQLTGTPSIVGIRMGQITIAQSGGAVTVDNAASLYIANAPTAGASVTLTNPYAFWVDAGTTRLDGALALGAQQTFVDADATPDVLAGSHFITNTTGVSITNFDAGTGTLPTGHIIYVESAGAITYDCTANASFNCGAADMVTASGDLTSWIYDGTAWNLINWMKTSATQTGADLAEWYVSYDELQPGDVVSIEPDENVVVEKSQTAYDKKLVGIVASSPGIVLGVQAQNTYAIALVGRVPTKVSLENGVIQRGDYLTSSSTPGVAMKATRPGNVIGKAMEGYNGTGAPVIMVFINTSYADPNDVLASLSLDATGNLVSSKAITAPNFVIPTSVEGSSSVADSSGPEDHQNDINVKDQLASISARLNDLEQQIATGSANPRNDDTASGSGTLADLGIVTPEELNATGSAQFADLKVTSQASFSGQLAAYDLTVSNSFKSLGQSILGATTIAGDLSIDGTLSITGNSLNAIGTSLCHSREDGNPESTWIPDQVGDDINGCGILYLQKSSLASGVDLFNGKVTIDKTGKLSVIQLEVSSETIGSASIPVNQLSVTVPNTLVSAKSRIFVTATSSTGGQALVVSQKTVGTGFTVSLDHTRSSNVTFDWWIVEEKP